MCRLTPQGWWAMCLQFIGQQKNMQYYNSTQEWQHTEANWKRPVTDYRHPLFVCLCVCAHTHAPRVPCVGAKAIQSTHAGVSLAIALLVDAAVTVGCPRRSLDIQCKSSPVELWKKLIICYCSLGPPVASPSEHHCHLTHGPRCDNGQ